MAGSMESQERRSREKLATVDIGGVSATLVRLRADEPMHKSYEVILGGETDNHVTYVKNAIVNRLDSLGYNTRHRFDDGKLEFPPQPVGGISLRPTVPTGNVLGSRAIYDVMQSLSQELHGPRALESAMRKERSSLSLNEDRHVMRMKTQRAGELLSSSEIVEIIMDTLRDHVTTGDHVIDPNITSESWQSALQESADEIQRRLIERIPVKDRLRFR